MNPFSESDLIELQARFPDRDVPRIAADCAKKNVKARWAKPLAMLTKWLETAEKNDTHRLDAITVSDTRPGMFKRDGSWDVKGFGDPDFHRFVDMLVTARRRDYPPDRIAERILREPELARAFPNAADWLTARGWFACPCSTSAEQCVKDAGYGHLPRDDDGNRPQLLGERVGLGAP